MTNRVERSRTTVTDTERISWSSRSAELEQLRRLGLWLPGPITALEVLDQLGAERAHQAYIAWLLDPRSPHGLGTRVLTNVLRRFGSADTADHQLSMARVRKEVVQAQSRADIVVTTPERTLVIELKVHSSEGEEQTRRLADDYTNWPDPYFVFLTLSGDQPQDTRFQSMNFDQFRILLNAAIKDAPKPRSITEVRGRATACDYLSALERKCGMEPVNQHAARFWLRHGHDMDVARSDAVRLLEQLPVQVETALRNLTGELDGNLQVSRVSYKVTAKYFSGPEVAVLLHRPQWRYGDEPRFGVGVGQRTLAKDIDPFNSDKRPFLGVWAADPDAQAVLGTGMEHRGWCNWAWWESIELSPPDNDVDLLYWCADVAVREVRRTWLDRITLIDRVAEQELA